MIRRNDKKTFLNLKKKMLLALIQKIASLGSLNQTGHQLLLLSLLLLLLPDCQLLLCLLLQEKDQYYKDRMPHHRASSSLGGHFAVFERLLHRVPESLHRSWKRICLSIEQSLRMVRACYRGSKNQKHQILRIFEYTLMSPFLSTPDLLLHGNAMGL